ncbi:MAG: orotidine-5'-phosphate decarboxylase [Dehalococcoidia bacterium]|nr:orotidine-5'-phosphate decarboxylase [Dehalococcoidia bacterium]
MAGFLEKLERACRTNQSLLCVGLDPVPERMPVPGIYEFNRQIIDATHDLVCAYKPNLAFYEAQGLEGLRALEKTLAAIPSHIPVIGDAKRGDIGPTAVAYAKAMYEVWGFDAATVNPYLGRDAVEPFLAYRDRGVFLVCRTSNPGAREFQDLISSPPFGGDPRPLYEWVALKAMTWNEAGNVGLVAGATYPDELTALRELCPDMPFLIPGLGAQGGDLERSVRNGADGRGLGAVLNVSRQVLYASADPGKFAAAARAVAQDIRGQMVQVLREMEAPWLSS